jgi:hypothetical protein
MGARVMRTRPSASLTKVVVSFPGVVVNRRLPLASYPKVLVCPPGSVTDAGSPGADASLSGL